MNGWVKRLRQLMSVVVAGGAMAFATHVVVPRDVLPSRTGPLLSDARSWGYQLQNAQPDRISPLIDVLVIDSQRNVGPLETLTPETVQRFQQRLDGSKRLVLAYLSIGEAEAYRHYWWPHWRALPPRWLAEENSDWKGNYKIRFWDAQWQKIFIAPKPTLLDAALERVMTSHKPYVDRIIDAGFDGIYLDRVDAYEDWRDKRPSAEADMVQFVTEIAAYARQRRPGFLVVPQNAEELLRNADYRKRIDGIAKEDLMFGVDHTETENKARDVQASAQFLALVKAEKKPVFVVEYLTDAEKRTRAEARMREYGFVLHFADRALNRAPIPMLTNTAPPAVTQPSVARPKG
jgi:cysteinyl-tRNA synthetase, unknown class